MSSACCQVWPRELAWQLATCFTLRSLEAGAVWGHGQCVQEVEPGLVLPPVPDGKLRKCSFHGLERI